MTPLTIFVWAFIGGTLPAIFWVAFWLREDRLEPEPKKIVFNVFIAGMFSVLIALVTENWLNSIVPAGSTISIILWSVIEELYKFFAAYLVALRTYQNNEPVDSMIYLITAALGFAALENTFFLLGPLGSGNVLGSFITGNLRFIGSSLLHVIASGTIGIFAAYAFCELRLRWFFIVGVGVILAIALHASFNFFILKGDNNLFTIFGSVWVGVVLLILFFERVKHINRTCALTNK